MKLKPGDKAPELGQPDQDGRIVRLSGFKGKSVVLYFYPKDMTPGCATEACGFRDYAQRFAEQGAVIIGVSPDDGMSHKKFIKRYSLPFALIADNDKRIAKAYGVWGPKKFMGREYDGIHRTTFIIDGKGIIRRIFRDVKPEGHGQEALEALG